MMLYRGVTLTYETVRYWCHKFSQTFANQIRRRRPQPGRSDICTRISSRLRVKCFGYGELWMKMAMR